MSLRPSLSSFRVQTLLDTFGCGNADIENAVLRKLRKTYADNLPLRVRASEIVRTIVHKGRDGQYPREEDETFQIAVDALARHGQEHVTCTSIFWERFFAEADAKKIVSSNPQVTFAVGQLVAGRPLFGAMNSSQWAYYGFIYNDQAAVLRDFIRGDATLSAAFDVESALAWLDATCDAGLDVWCWVS